jgi:hypothetical protein
VVIWLELLLFNIGGGDGGGGVRQAVMVMFV